VLTLINLKKKKRLFWILQTSGWSLYFAFTLIIYWRRGNLTSSTFIECAWDAVMGFLITLILRSFYKKIKIHDYSVLTLFLLAFLLSFLAAGIIVWISVLLPIPGSGWEDPSAGMSLRYNFIMVISWIAPLIGWSALYFGIKFWQEWMIQKEKTEKANALAQTAQLQMLRYRMNPHFLFNALNSIRALISENKINAKRMITELSEYLRYSLVSRNYRNVPLRDEMDSIRHYFEIQKIRYEDKLDVLFDIDPSAEEYPIVSFLLHPLVENAVCYGMRTSSMPLKIAIKAELLGKKLRIEIRNSGTWVEPSDQEESHSIGKGLDNLRRRLEDAYPGKHHFEIFEKEDSVHARLNIESENGR
jgi:two-component system LytT family sensor kinase